MSTITVVIPTVPGREQDYARCVAAYQTRSHHQVDLITVRDMPTCGQAWNTGAEQATGDYLHFTADDLEPHDGWDIAAIETVERGFLPAPRIINPAGDLDYCGEHRTELPDWAPVRMSVIPFMPLGLWPLVGPSLPGHYFTDDYLSWRGMRAGWVTVVRRSFSFTHHWAEAGRGAGMSYQDRMAHDMKAYLAATSGAAVG